MVDADITVQLDGTPASVAVNVANTSTTVGGYVVDAVDAPPWLTVEPGSVELLPGTQGVVEAVVRVDSATLVPAQQVPLLLRARTLTAQPAYRDLPVRVTVPVVDGPVTLRTEPQLIRTRGLTPGVCTVVVANPTSNRWKQVRMSAEDPENVVHATWVSSELQVPPGGEARTQVRLDAPPPGMGGEVSRTITVSASDGLRRAATTVTLVQSVSRSAIELVGLQLDPAVLRLGSRRRGSLTAVVDNRRGSDPAVVSLHASDPEDCLRFALSPSAVTVQPGALAPVHVTVTASRTPPGQETTRPFMIVASDGRTDIRADGEVVQLTSSRRGLARVLLTLLGALAMLVGVYWPFAASGSLESAINLSAVRLAEIAAQHGLGDVSQQVRDSGVGDVVSLGLVVIVFAALMVFGLTGRSGRLTRVSALLCAVLVVSSLVALGILQSQVAGPAGGGLMILVGCVVGYIGGLVDRR